MKKVETEKEKKGSGGCFLAGFSTYYLFRRMFRGSRTHHCALRLMRRLGTAHCALYVTLCALVNNTRVWPSLLPLFLPPLSFFLARFDGLDFCPSFRPDASDRLLSHSTARIPLHTFRIERNSTAFAVSNFLFLLSPSRPT